MITDNIKNIASDCICFKVMILIYRKLHKRFQKLQSFLRVLLMIAYISTHCFCTFFQTF